MTILYTVKTDLSLQFIFLEEIVFISTPTHWGYDLKANLSY